MEKSGFLGYGHMGSVMLKALLSAGALDPQQVVIFNRTREKLEELKAAFPAIQIAAAARDAAACPVVFLCVGTYAVRAVLDEIGPALAPETHLVSIAGGLEITSLERAHPGPITKIIPSMVAEVCDGVTLVCHNPQVTPEQRKRLEAMFAHIGAVSVIREEQFEVAADLTSCAPGLLAAVFDEMVRAAMRHGGLGYAEACAMLLPTVSGTAGLLRKNGEAFDALIARVATQGGSTEAGVAVLKDSLPGVFDRMIAATLERHVERKRKTREQFG
jgi:pyrroline-5-carboxylate reductase